MSKTTTIRTTKKLPPPHPVTFLAFVGDGAPVQNPAAVLPEGLEAGRTTATGAAAAAVIGREGCTGAAWETGRPFCVGERGPATSNRYRTDSFDELTLDPQRRRLSGREPKSRSSLLYQLGPSYQ